VNHPSFRVGKISILVQRIGLVQSLDKLICTKLSCFRLYLTGAYCGTADC